ncbi:cell division protein ZapA, partial [Paenibacillus validus]
MNGEDKVRMTVDIYGSQYKLVSKSSPSYIKRVVAVVNDQMHRIAAGSPRLDLPKIAVLAAVNMADEWTRMQQEVEAAQEQQRELARVQGELAALTDKYGELQQSVDADRERLRSLSAERDELLAVKAAFEGKQVELQGQVEELGALYEVAETELTEKTELLRIREERLTQLEVQMAEALERAREFEGRSAEQARETERLGQLLQE